MKNSPTGPYVAPYLCPYCQHSVILNQNYCSGCWKDPHEIKHSIAEGGWTLATAQEAISNLTVSLGLVIANPKKVFDAKAFEDAELSRAQRVVSTFNACEEILDRHPRAAKLMREGKGFFVVAADEPYALSAVSMIKTEERAKGRWTAEDESNAVRLLREAGVKLTDHAWMDSDGEVEARVPAEIPVAVRERRYLSMLSALRQIEEALGEAVDSMTPQEIVEQVRRLPALEDRVSFAELARDNAITMRDEVQSRAKNKARRSGEIISGLIALMMTEMNPTTEQRTKIAELLSTFDAGGAK